MSGFLRRSGVPFAWLTSKWARMVQAQRDYTAGWRFISLPMINPAWTTTAISRRDTGRSGRRAEAAARRRPDQGPARPRRGRAAVRGRRRPPVRHRQQFRPCQWRIPRHPHLPGPSSPRRACQPNWLTRREDTSSDAGIRPETGEALAMMRYQDADHPVPGPGRRCVLRPGDQPPARRRRGRGRELRDTVPRLASFPRFAEPKRSVRERPQHGSLGVEPCQARAGEDWKAGSRRAPE
jgi:hypothetical protein